MQLLFQKHWPRSQPKASIALFLLTTNAFVGQRTNLKLQQIRLRSLTRRWEKIMSQNQQTMTTNRWSSCYSFDAASVLSFTLLHEIHTTTLNAQPTLLRTFIRSACNYRIQLIDYLNISTYLNYIFGRQTFNLFS